MEKIIQAMIGSIVGRVNGHIAYEAYTLLEVVGEARLLQDELYIISEAVKSSTGKHNEQLYWFMSQIEELVYDAEDAIDMYMNPRRAFWTCGRIAKEIIAIRRRLEEKCYFRLEFARAIMDLKEFDVVVQIKQLRCSQGQTLMVFLENGLVGFDAEKSTIIEQLTSEDAELKTIGIWGMSGIGKTNLCHSIYNNLVVASHFDLRVCVSFSHLHTLRDFMEAAMKCIVELSPQEMKNMTDEMMRLELYRYMNSTRYLIVLDDVWESKLCEDLNNLFPRNMFGSRIMITTQVKEVVHSNNKNHSYYHNYYYHLQPLDIDKSWNLLSNHVFQGGKCPPELKDLGIQIAHKCAGLPLAILVIGGVLLIKKTFGAWSRVLSSLSESFHVQSGFLELGYSYLPYHLRRCFLYLACFPKDSEIPTRQLTLLWVAEGLIPKNKHATLEVIAHLFLEELVYRNLVQPAQIKSYGGVKSIRIHNLVRDFCISKSSCGEKDHINHPTISILHYISCNPTVPHVRRIFSFGPHRERVSSKQWKSLYTGIMMRVLDLWGVLVDNIPSDIDKLICLRYLRLMSDSAQTLPPSICNLLNLQTLDLTAPLIERPQINLWKMHRLRHFYFNGEAIIPEPPKEIVNNGYNNSLTDIQTLCFISPASCIESVLSKMPNLIKLGIYGNLEEDIAFHNLSKLKLLRKLKLMRDLRYKRLSRLPCVFQFPPTLHKLTLSQTELSSDPMEQLGRLHNLQVLKLIDSAYSGNALDCSRCEFHQLKVLKLVNLGITSWHVAPRSMPRLRSVVINRCGGLKGLPSSLKQMSTLRELQLWWPNVKVVACARDIKTCNQNAQLKVIIYHAQEI